MVLRSGVIIYFKNRVVHNNLTMMRKMRLEHNATRKTSGAANKSSTLRTQTALDTQKQHFAACAAFLFRKKLCAGAHSRHTLAVHLLRPTPLTHNPARSARTTAANAIRQRQPALARGA
jgi:hypothetical protein